MINNNALKRNTSHLNPQNTTDSRSRILERFLSAPWHGWLKEDKQFLQIIIELLLAVPMKAFNRITLRERPLIILPPLAAGRLVALHQYAFPQGLLIVQLTHQIADKPNFIQKAILAHELAHIFLLNSDLPPNELELATDKIVISWGLGHELLAALRTDLPDSHERIQRCLSLGL